MKTKWSKRKKAILISSLSQLKTKTERKPPKTRVKPVKRPKKTGFVALDGFSSVDVIRCVCWQEAGGVTRPASVVLRSIFPPFLLAAEPSYLLSQTQTACSFSAGKYYFSESLWLFALLGVIKKRLKKKQQQQQQQQLQPQIIDCLRLELLSEMDRWKGLR